MASAEQYAAWIVANADKKGTPEFDTVARAYQAARSMQAQPTAAPAPALDVSSIDKDIASKQGELANAQKNLQDARARAKTNPGYATVKTLYAGDQGKIDSALGVTPFAHQVDMLQQDLAAIQRRKADSLKQGKVIAAPTTTQVVLEPLKGIARGAVRGVSDIAGLAGVFGQTGENIARTVHGWGEEAIKGVGAEETPEMQYSGPGQRLGQFGETIGGIVPFLATEGAGAIAEGAAATSKVARAAQVAAKTAEVGMATGMGASQARQQMDAYEQQTGKKIDEPTRQLVQAGGAVLGAGLMFPAKAILDKAAPEVAAAAREKLTGVLSDLGNSQIGKSEAVAAIRSTLADVNATTAGRVVTKGVIPTAGIMGGVQLGQNVLARESYNPDQDIWAGVPETAIMGGLTGGLLRGGSEHIQSKQLAKLKDAPAFHTVLVASVTPNGEPTVAPVDIMTAPNKHGDVLVRDAAGNITPSTVKAVDAMRVAPAEGEERLPLHEELQQKLDEHNEAVKFVQHVQDAIKDPENAEAHAAVADRYAKLYGIHEDQAKQYADAYLAKARGETPKVEPKAPLTPEGAREFAPPEAYAEEVPPPALRQPTTEQRAPEKMEPARAAEILNDDDALQNYADQKGIDVEEAVDQLGALANTGIRYMRGRPPKDLRAQAEAAGQESLFGVMPKQEEGRLSKAEELTQRKLELTPEERIAQQVQVSGGAEQRIAEATQRNQEVEAQRLQQAQADIHSAHPDNTGYEVRKVEDSPVPYQVVGPKEIDGSHEIFVAEKNLKDFEDAVGDLPPYTPRPLSAQAVEGGREVPDTPYTQINRDLVGEISAARDANKITDSEKAALINQVSDSSRRTTKIEEGEAEYRNAMGELRNADNDMAKRAAEIRINNVAEDLRKLVNNVVANPVRARLKSLTEGREEEKFGARMRMENAKVQEALGRMEGANVAPEQREQREAGIDIAEAAPSRYMRGEKEAGGAPKAVSREDVERVVAQDTAGWSSDVPVKVVGSIDELPESIRSAVEADKAHDAYGLVGPDGTIHLIADNLPTIEDARAALFHEALGHVGLAKLFREELDGTLQKLYDSNPKLKGDTDAWVKKNPEAYATDANPLARAVEEVLASRSEKGRIELPLLKRIAAVVREFARKLGFKVQHSDNDIAHILSMAHDRAIGGKAERAEVPSTRYMPKTPEEAEDLTNRGVEKASLANDATNFLGGLDDAAMGTIAAAKMKSRARLEAIESWVKPKELALKRTDDIKDTINRMSSGVGEAINNLDRIAQRIRGMKNSMTKAMGRRVKEFQKFVNKHGQDVISGMMTIARVNRVDVTAADSLAELLKADNVAELYRKNMAAPGLSQAQQRAYAGHLKRRENDIKAAWRQWEKLGKQPGGQELYKQVRQFYKDMYVATRAELDKGIAGFGLDKASTDKLLAAARREDISTDGERLTGENDVHPGVPQKLFPEEYFPFRRFGEHTLLVAAAKGRERARYHFESAYERNMWQEELARRYGLKRGTDEYNQTFKQLDGREARDSIAGDSAMLREMFKVIEGADASNKEELKDRLYQTYLMTLPERSLRKQFIHAELTTGNSADALRILKNSVSQYTTQLPKMAYGQDIRNNVESARELIGDRDPHEGAILRKLVDTYINRYQENLNPTNGPGKIERGISTFTFFEMMSSATSAAVQLTGILQAMPRMFIRYNPAQALKLLDKYTPIWSTIEAVTEIDPATGKKYIVPPSLGNTPVVKNSPVARELWKRLNDERDLFSQNHTNMLLRNRRTKNYGTAGALNALGSGYEHAVHLSGVLMSSADQLVRELTGMTFAELHYNQMRKKGASHEEALDGAVEAAIRNTNETIGNFTELNKPDIFKGNWAKRAFGYLRTYSRERTAYYFRQMRDTLKGSPYQTRLQAASELTAVTLLGAAAGGAATTFGYSAICALINAIYPTFFTKEENERRRREDPRAADDADYRFREQWIPLNFGSDSMAAKVAKHGALSEITGADLGSRISQNDLWVRGGLHGKDYKEQAVNFVEDNFSPQLSQGLQLADALTEFGRGNMSRGFAKVLPAAVRGWVTANRLETEGERTAKGDLPVMAPQEFTPQDIAAQRLGATPLKLAEIREQNRRIYDWQNAMSNEREDLLTDTRKMLLKPHTQDDIAKAVAKIRDFNAKVPMDDKKFIIEAKDIMQSAKSSLQKQETSVRGVVMSPAERAYLTR